MRLPHKGGRREGSSASCPCCLLEVGSAQMYANKAMDGTLGGCVHGPAEGKMMVSFEKRFTRRFLVLAMWLLIANVATVRAETLPGPPRGCDPCRASELVELVKLDPTIKLSGGTRVPSASGGRSAVVGSPVAEGPRLRSRRLRRLSPVVRHQAVLGHHAAGQANIRRRSVDRLHAQSRMRRGYRAVRLADRAPMTK